MDLNKVIAKYASRLSEATNYGVMFEVACEELEAKTQEQEKEIERLKKLLEENEIEYDEKEGSEE